MTIDVNYMYTYDITNRFEQIKKPVIIWIKLFD